MQSTSYEVVERLFGHVYVLPKTWRDYQWEKMQALKEISAENSPYTPSERATAKALARTIRTQLERGYK
jgi:hypothetical protein